MDVRLLSLLYVVYVAGFATGWSLNQRSPTFYECL